MNLFHKIQFYTLIILLFSTCSKEIKSNENPNNGNNYLDIYYDPDVYCKYPSLLVGENSSLDILTWNLENFPSNGDTTANFISSIIDTLNMDLLVFQEIGSEYAFNKIIEGSNKWENIFSDEGSYSLAAIFNTQSVSIEESYKILEEDEYYFAWRPPQLIKIKWNNEEMIIINTHFKCCTGSEDRRREASALLDEYITMNHPNDKVILLGDLNDNLIDEDNVFEPFNNTTKYVFADYPLASSCTSNNWSYPSYPSHIDHILLSNELFDYSFECNVLNIEYYYFNSFNDYKLYISDHRPVALKIQL